MRLVATEYLSLDGVFEEPGQWSLPFFSDDVGEFKYAELMAADALLLGRRTYDGFAAAWPTMEEATGEFGVIMNSITKYVATSGTEPLEWTGAQRLQGDVVSAVRALKDKPGRDLLLAGSGRLFTILSNAGLIDVYRMMVHPIVMGSGTRLFTEEVERRTLTLSANRTFASGIVVLEYGPAEDD